MPDEVQKLFVGCFISYLKKVMDSKTLTSDSQESVEVAIQCLQAAFDIDEETLQNTPEEAKEEEAANAVNTKVIDLFEMFQSFYVERNPDSLQLAERIKNEGNRLMKDGKYNEALLQYNRAIGFDPKNPIYYCNRAAAHIRLGDNQRAVTDCKSAIVYNSQYGKAYGRLGIAYSNLGKYDEAQQAYTKAIELEPDNQDYRNNLEVARNDARNAASTIMGMESGFEALLNNPTIRSMYDTTGINLEQLRDVARNEVVINFVSRLFSGPYGNVLNNDPILRTIQSIYDNSISSNAPGNEGTQNNGENQEQLNNQSSQPPPPPPPSTSS